MNPDKLTLRPFGSYGPRLGTTAANLGLTLAGLVMVVPFLWTLSTSFKTGQAATELPPSLIPNPITIENYRTLGDVLPFWRILANSIIVTVVATFAQVITSAMAGYGLARYRFRGREALMLLYLGTLMVPFQVTIVPLFLMMRWLGWINSLQALIVPSVASAFGVFLFRQFFMQMPREYEEAAAIDGAGPWRTFLYIALPYAKPAAATHGILAFMGSWNAFLWPLFIARDESAMTLPVGLSALNGRYSTDFALVMAGVVVTIVPVITVFATLQRHISGGLLLGSGGK
ncbi:carbohydrate ABC transporter permease [Acidimicrobium ferrooxidans]|uniref:Carbohydrate ABC transporter permease n=1 Tax=Acidimicrobium ferrooxidans TaxID=53635 RepID=A0ABS3APE6_9ACTN|nr:carbohydrate ABC transporter permease [Acidimicrobium ferrooxidans]